MRVRQVPSAPLVTGSRWVRSRPNLGLLCAPHLDSVVGAHPEVLIRIGRCAARAPGRPVGVLGRQQAHEGDETGDTDQDSHEDIVHPVPPSVHLLPLEAGTQEPGEVRGLWHGESS